LVLRAGRIDDLEGMEAGVFTQHGMA
jgi:hypothetical protein